MKHSRSFALAGTLLAAMGSLTVIGLWPGHAGKASGESTPERLQVPAGFVVELVAGPPLVQHPMMAAFDERGRLFIAESAGMNLKADDLRKQLPNFVRVLEPANSKGLFSKSGIFADKMTFPMGALWHKGELFVASSGGLWRMKDTMGAGVADVREEIVNKFNYTGNAADIHGPFLGQDGRLYWCDGRHGHEITRPDGTVMKGKAARIFRSRLDGTQVEVICGGGMDNPVEIAFTAECEPLVTVDILHNQPARNDGIIYAIEGGVYPWHDVYKEFPRTGELLPAAGDLGWVAPSGLTCYRGDAFGKPYQGNLFSAQFNRNRIQRHILERAGAGFRMKTEDFLTCSDKNFHPTDVLEDADGSLLVIDTGGWFRIGCPTSKIAQPEIKGGIYRIRKVDAPTIPDPRGLQIAWNKLVAQELTSLLDDPRFMVRDRAVQALADLGDQAAPALTKALQTSKSCVLCRNAVWALTRMDSTEARRLVRLVLDDKDMSVRLAALHSAGLHRDAAALPKIMDLVVKDQEPAVRRQAATALGRIRDAKAVPALMESLRQGGDRFLEHALIYALIQIDDRAALLPYLQEPGPSLRRAALIALDQMPSGNLTKELVTPLLATANAALLKTTVEVIANKPGWGKEIVGLLRQWVAEPALDASRRESLRGVVLGLSGDPAIQELTAEALAGVKTSVPVRLMLLEAMARAPLAKLPASWTRELGKSLTDTEEKVALQAVACVRSRNLNDFDGTLLKLGEDTSRGAELRVAALAAAAPRLGKIDAAAFDFLAGQLGEQKPPLLRLAAAGALGKIPLSEKQLEQLAGVIAGAGALEMPHLLGAFEKSTDPQVGRLLVKSLDKAPGLASVTPAVLDRAFQHFPMDVRLQADKLSLRLQVDVQKQKARLSELEPMLGGGDADRGKGVFYGAKASCSACHVVDKRGGNFGPDLSKIGAIRAGRDLLESLVFPSSSFARGFESYVIETKSGSIVTGILGRESGDAVFLITADRAEIRVARADIEAFVPGRVSIMPQGLDAQLSPAELRDLLAYLQGLR